jgi:hypothetical protein
MDGAAKKQKTQTRLNFTGKSEGEVVDSFVTVSTQTTNSQSYTLFFPSLPFLLGIWIFNYPPDLKIFLGRLRNPAF